MSALLPPRPVRRAVIDPLWVLLALPLAAVFALGALLGTVLPFGRERRLLRASMLALEYLYADVGLILGAVRLSLTVPRRARGGGAWHEAHCRLLTWALERVRAAASRWARFEIALETEPFEEPPSGPAVVVARHAGLGDSFALVYLILTWYQRRPLVVLKASLQWDPGIDVVLNRLGSCFLPSGTGSGEDLVDRLEQVAATMRSRDALLIFPEGRNWTPRRRHRVLRHLHNTGRHRAARRAERMRRVLPPRSAGTLACIAARPDAHVVVVAHTGLDHIVNAATAWRALPLTAPFRVAWWCVSPPTDLASDGDSWLTEQWTRVDEWILAHDAVPA
jgi:1-acyl-sn-glycerol-3-phosphate acyltransferase